MSLLQLSQRRLKPELMDGPGLERGRHEAALKGLGRVNFWTASCRDMWHRVEQLGSSTGTAPIRILDVATGGGDVAVGLWQKAKRRGLSVEVSGCDISPVAVEYARSRAARRGMDIRFFEHDVVSNPFKDEYDVAVCSHFVHHLEKDALTLFLSRLKETTRRLILIQDLARSPGGWLFAYVGVRLITLSDIVRVDATRSVEAAFRADELKAIAGDAGLTDCEVIPHWPFRFLLTWEAK